MSVTVEPASWGVGRGVGVPDGGVCDDDGVAVGDAPTLSVAVGDGDRDGDGDGVGDADGGTAAYVSTLTLPASPLAPAAAHPAPPLAGAVPAPDAVAWTVLTHDDPPPPPTPPELETPPEPPPYHPPPPAPEAVPEVHGAPPLAFQPAVVAAVPAVQPVTVDAPPTPGAAHEPPPVAAAPGGVPVPAAPAAV